MVGGKKGQTYSHTPTHINAQVAHFHVNWLVIREIHLLIGCKYAHTHAPFYVCIYHRSDRVAAVILEAHKPLDFMRLIRLVGLLRMNELNLTCTK